MSLNEQEKQLLETLLSQADAVSPSSERSQHAEHTDFHNSNNDFHFLDKLINSGMGNDIESMAFSQSTSSASFVEPRHNTSFQSGVEGQDSQQNGSVGQAFTQQPATAYASQQSPMRGFQQYSSTLPSSNSDHVPMSPSMTDDFESQGAGYQQQFPTATQKSLDCCPLDQPGPTTDCYGNSSSFTSQFKLDLSLSAPSNLVSSSSGLSFQAQTASFPESDSSVESDQPKPYHHSTGPFQHAATGPTAGSGGADVNSLSPGGCQSQVADYQHQPFPNHFSPAEPSVASVPAVSQTGSIHQHFQGTPQCASVGDTDSSAATLDFSSQIPGFQTQQHQQSTLFQQGNPQASGCLDKALQESRHDGTLVHYQPETSGFSQEPQHQQQQQAVVFPHGASSSAVLSSTQAGSFPQQQQQLGQFPNCLHSCGQKEEECGSAGVAPIQLSDFQMQPSFQSPASSTSQSSSQQQVSDNPNTYHSFANSPAPYQQQTTGFGSQNSIHILAPSTAQTEQNVGVCQAQIYPQQGDQSLGVTFHSQGSPFSHSIIHQGDQTVSSTDAQAQPQCYTGETVVQDQQSTDGFKSQTSGFVHHAFQLSSQTSTQQDHELMQETPRERKMEAESTAFVSDSSLTHTTSLQDQTMEVSAGDGQFREKVKSFDQQSPITLRQQEQPMDTQQSPFYSSATADSSRVYEAKTTTLSLPQTAEAGESFLKQSTRFQGNLNGFQATPAVCSSEDGMQQFAGFIPSSLPVNTIPFSPKPDAKNNTMCSNFTNSSLFGSQSIGVAGQNTARPSFAETSQVSDNSSNTPTPSPLQSDVLNQSAASFNQFENSNGSTFINSSKQQQQSVVQHQLEQQPLHMPQQLVQQQQQHQTHLQHGIYSQGEQTRDSFSLNQNASSEILTAFICQEAGPHFGQGLSSAPQVPLHTASVPVVNSNQQDSSHFQPARVAVGQQQGPAPAHVVGTHQPSPPFNMANLSSNSHPQQSPITLTPDKSPLAALFDSRQANAALNLLASVVLSQIQAVLPHSAQIFAASQHQKEGGVLSSGNVPSAVAAVSDPMQQFFQRQVNLNDIVPSLLIPQQQQQQQTFQPQLHHQTAPSQIHHLTQSQAVPFQQCPPSSQTQPSFLAPQVSQQAAFLPQQQSHQQDPSTASWHPQQQILQVPSSIASSLGLTVTSNGQLMIGEQVVKLVVQPSSSDGGSGVSGTLSSPLEGAAGLQQTMFPALMVSLPADLKNIDVQPFGSALVTSSHLTVTTTAPSLDSNISGHTSVTSSFSATQPVPAVTAPEILSLASISSDIVSGPAVTPFMTAGVEPVTVQASKDMNVLANATEGPANVADVFHFPGNPAAGIEKPMEISQSSGTGLDSVGAFINVAEGSASMTLLNAFKMAVADQHQDAAGFQVPGCPPTQTLSAGLANIEDTCKPMETNERSGKSSILKMDVSEVAGQAYSDVFFDNTKVKNNETSQRLVRKSSAEDKVEERIDSGSMLRRILTMEDNDALEGLPSSDMLPEGSSPETSPHKQDLDSPNALVADTNTQATLIEKSEKLDLSCEAHPEDEVPSQFWSSVEGFPAASVDEVVPSKVHKGLSDQDASCKIVTLPSVEKLFDAGGASSCSSFVFTKFGSEDCVFTFGTCQASLVSTSATETKVTSVISSSSVKQPDCVKLCVLPAPPIRPSSRRQKEASLSAQFPSKVGSYELRILTQPEEQHRARYLTEGSRGAVKDRSQQGYPVIKLHGYKEPATLQVFIGNEAGRIKPHGFYQACRVCGKNSTPCTEREIEGTTVIEIEISPMNDMIVSMDCVGILKLRNADVEKRIGIARAKAKKKNSTKARLVFRVALRKLDGSFITLQTASTPILCTQPIGQPEISRMSLSEISINQTKDLFIIGKNFLKGTRVVFQKLGLDEKTVEWQSEAEIEAEYFQQTHLICKVPEYPKKDIEKPVYVQIVVQSGGKSSDPQDFIYTPGRKGDKLCTPRDWKELLSINFMKSSEI
ncbi:uncharacterized protein LOC112576423 isoform X3 [Pomacea canaliculata]|uniref:uncharacterized protein LOC112576423 isoform X3 n=1 Tax=Pomacea canaliculata TaxID=400727 RepID=UPI000D725BA4|nr:uncharacterized protein LOC112576423 isoform X3 [Pomacea canaliculata]XP_025114591.1 uncharacterized protein LOC112576423 isoform X3 [Pomacea canaliculata]XP_025114592.1 uncharacterized protein LOC112576423 isoform X3 [Pomacea canaliculata]